MALETCEHCSRRRLGCKSRGKRRRMEVMNSERHLADAVGIGPTDWSLSRRQVLAGRWQHSVRTGRLRDPPTTGRDDELYQNRRPIRPRYGILTYDTSVLARGLNATTIEIIFNNTHILFRTNFPPIKTV
jgi:hypothetical protein